MHFGFGGFLIQSASDSNICSDSGSDPDWNANLHNYPVSESDSESHLDPDSFFRHSDLGSDSTSYSDANSV